MPPRVSVIIPTHNRPELLIHAVNSVLHQSYPHVELIVVDDGSTCCHSEAREFVMRTGGVFLSQEHKGVAAARNRGFEASTGELIAYLDSDDVWQPEKLSVQVAYLDDHPEYHIVQCPEIWFRSGRRVNPRAHHIMKEGDLFQQSLSLCCISPSAVMIRRSVFKEIGGWDERFLVCEDYELWLRMTARYMIGLCPEALVHKYGGHSDQLSKAFPAMDRFRAAALLKLLDTSKLLPHQRVAVLTEISTKFQILIQGAQKRERFDHAACYREILKELMTASKDAELLSSARKGLTLLFNIISSDFNPAQPFLPAAHQEREILAEASDGLTVSA